MFQRDFQFKAISIQQDFAIKQILIAIATATALAAG